MNIYEEFNETRNMIISLKNYDEDIANKRHIAGYGTGKRFNDVKVTTSRKTNFMEDRIIEYQENEKRRSELLEKYMDACNRLENYIDKYCKKAKYIDALYSYFIFGKSIKDIPNCTINTVKNAVKHIRDNIDLEEEIKKQPEAVQKLIRGGKKKCKHCENGYIKYMKEESDRFIFVCDECGRRLKSDKIGAHETTQA